MHSVSFVCFDLTKHDFCLCTFLSVFLFCFVPVSMSLICLVETAVSLGSATNNTVN